MLNVEGPVTIYTDKRKAIRIVRLRCLCLLPISLLMFAWLTVAPHPQDSFNSLLSWILIVETPMLYFLVTRALTRQTKPIISLSSLGITVNLLGMRVGFLRWDEIKDVYTYRFCEGFVGITLNDPKTVYRRIGLKGSWVPRLNDLVAPLYKPFRIRIAPISIPQAYLPGSADELLAQIQMYRATYA
ncbi:MAG: hypothetical protein JWL77_5091 [Chthonomonadaceae bacterium]|nr:hypothetical protein [Chthonomonadaceae bacterium]